MSIALVGWVSLCFTDPTYLTLHLSILEPCTNSYAFESHLSTSTSHPMVCDKSRALPSKSRKRNSEYVRVDGRGTFFFNDTATTEIYTLSLHDALPILRHGLPTHSRHPLAHGRHL